MRLPLWLTFLLTLTACTADSEEVNIRLTMNEREQLDKLVVSHMDSLRPVLDSLCKATFEDRVAVATDSIVQRLLEEEARLRARIPKDLRNDR